VLQVYGVDDDTDLQTVVEGFLDDAVREMNSHLYEFNKRTETGIALSASTRDYTLTSTAGAQVYRESLAYLVTTAGVQQANLVYLPWAHFQSLYGDQTLVNSGVPSVYSMRNVDFAGTVSLQPIPNTSVASSYTLTVEYYRRIPLPYTDAEDPIEVAPEVETVLVYNAQKRLAIHLHGPGHKDVAAFDALERRAQEELQAVDKRHPDAQRRFRLVDHGASRHHSILRRPGVLIIE
jgi:hypothetical protein